MDGDQPREPVENAAIPDDPKRRHTHPFVVVLDRLRSAHNTGNVFRLADVTGAREVCACGYTPAPPHPKLTNTARGAETVVPCRQFDTSLEAVKQLQSEGYCVVAVDTVPDAPILWDAEWEWPAAFVFGNEALGIEPEAIASADRVVRLPVFGLKNSMNVGNCAAVVLYEAVKRLQ